MEPQTKTNLTPEQIAARRAYKRQWNAAHPDRVAEHQRRYWQKKYKEQQEQEHRQELK